MDKVTFDVPPCFVRRRSTGESTYLRRGTVGYKVGQVFGVGDDGPVGSVGPPGVTDPPSPTTGPVSGTSVLSSDSRPSLVCHISPL